MAKDIELKREDIGIVGNFIKCMKEYVNFRGRADRYEYWSFVLCRDLIISIVGIVSAFFGQVWILTVVSLIFVLPYLGVLARRMHDQGKSLKKYILPPFLLFVLLLFVVFLEGMLGYIYGVVPTWLEYAKNASAIIFTVGFICAFLIVLFYTVRCGKMEDNKYGPKIPFDKKLNEKGRLVMIIYLIYYLFLFAVDRYLSGFVA